MKSSVSLLKRQSGFDVEQFSTVAELPSLVVVTIIFKGKIRGCSLLSGVLPGEES